MQCLMLCLLHFIQNQIQKCSKRILWTKQSSTHEVLDLLLIYLRQWLGCLCRVIKMIPLSGECSAVFPPTALSPWTHSLSIMETSWNKINVAFPWFQAVMMLVPYYFSSSFVMMWISCYLAWVSYDDATLCSFCWSSCDDLSLILLYLLTITFTTGNFTA